MRQRLDDAYAEAKKIITENRSVVALLPRRGTGEIVFADRGHRAAAGRAEHLAGEHVLCAPILPEFGAHHGKAVDLL